MGFTKAQEEAITTAGRPLFIQAGAGTGKTFTLTNRLAYGLSAESGPLIRSVDDLLVITFTNKAAGELMGRVRAELRRRGLMAESLGVDAAWISTIHSMCRRILLAHAFEAGIDPGAALLTEEETRDLLGTAVEQLLQERAGDAGLQLLLARHKVADVCKLLTELALELQLSPQGAASFALGPDGRSAAAVSGPGAEGSARSAGGSGARCADDAESTEPADGAGGAGSAAGPRGGVVSPGPLVELLARFRAAKAELDELGLPEGKKTYQQNYDAVGAAIETLGRVLEAGEDAVVADALASCKNLRGGSFKEPYKGIFAEVSGALKEAKGQAAAAFARAELDAALDLAADVCGRHSRLKAARGALDTNDLLIGTYRLLERDPEIAAGYRARFDSVMVDEFQDTDRLQVGIIERFCDEGLTTLATVGDAQQSIYGFRGADLEVYRGVRADMAAHGSREVELATNFRSHPDILGFVEAIFSTPEFFGGEFLKVEPGPDNRRDLPWVAGDDVRVEVLLSAGQSNPDNRRARTGVDALRAMDARQVADEFERLHAAGAAFGDMAVLLKSIKADKAGPYLRELRRRGIPCVVAGGSDYYTLPEVRALSMFLRFLADRDDDEALFEVLGSPLFDMTDDELLALAVVDKQEIGIAPDEARRKPSLYDAICYQVRRLPQDDADELIVAHRILSAALSDARSLPLSAVVARAVEASGWRAVLASGGAQGQAVQANVQRFCDLLDDYEAANGRSVLGAAEHFREMCELAADGSGARGKPGTMVADGNAAVQIMTIHSSKGLEFPIVAVAEYERSSRRGGLSVASLSEGGQGHLALADFPDKATRDYLADEQLDPGSFAAASGQAAFASHALRLADERAAEEQQRLLYVALTRARDFLILVAHDATYASKGGLSAGLTADVMGALFEDGMPQGRSVTKLRTGAKVLVQTTEVPFDARADEISGDGAGAARPVGHVTITAPAREPRILPRAPRRRELVSYSSLARAAAEGSPAGSGHAGAPARDPGGPGRPFAGTAAPAAGVSVSGGPLPAPGQPAGASPSGAGVPDSGAPLVGGADAHEAATGGPAGAAGPEAASALGSAFHLAAQWVAETGVTDAGAVARRCAAAARRYGLGEGQRGRLADAVGAWFASARFEQTRAFPERHAEYAFCVDVDGLPLEGAIDLLCLDRARRQALVIDYKTGTSGAGEPDELRARYALQAAAYAYAVLASGLADEVELAFVRPEAGMEEVDFRYAAADLSALAGRLQEAR